MKHREIILSHKSESAAAAVYSQASYKSTNQSSGLWTRGQESFTMKDEIFIVNILGCWIIWSQFCYPSAKQPRTTQTNDPGLFQESCIYTSKGPDLIHRLLFCQPSDYQDLVSWCGWQNTSLPKPFMSSPQNL